MADAGIDGSMAAACGEAAPSSLTGSQEIDVVLSMGLLVLSGMFSGLTLGLMSMDVNGLKIVISGGSETDRRYAQKIMPLREKGNLLLCTLLLGNTLVNALIAILSASITSGLVGALLSTGFIVIFGEIMPQSVCSRYGLLIGAHTVGIVRLFVIVLWPVAYPISYVLDWVLGDEMGVIYNRHELERLVELHEEAKEADIQSGDAALLKGALKFSSVQVSEIMTERLLSGAMGTVETGIFMLDVNGKLDFPTMLEMHKRGHTRVPVCDGDPLNPNSAIVGLMLTKDLMLVDPDDELSISALLQFCGRDILAVPDTLALDRMLDIFKESRTHLFFVQPADKFGDGSLAPAAMEGLGEAEQQLTIKRSISSEMELRAGSSAAGTQPPLHNVCGIVTMEDVLEELIQAEIMDETDVYTDNKTHHIVKRGMRELSEMEEREAFFRAMVGPKGQSTLRLSKEETSAVVLFLCLHVDAFKRVTDLVVTEGKVSDGNGGQVSLTRVRELLAACTVEDCDVVPENERVPAVQRQLYTAGQSTETCTLVLTGRLKIVAGVEGFVSEAGPFSVLSAGALTIDKSRGSFNAPYIADFTATVQEKARLIRITRTLYEQMIAGQQLLPAMPGGDAGAAGVAAAAGSPRSMAKRLQAAAAEQPAASPSAGGKKQGAGARLEAATRLRALSRDSRSKSETQLSQKAAGSGEWDEVSLLVPAGSGGIEGTTSGASSTGTNLSRLESGREYFVKEGAGEEGSTPVSTPDRESDGSDEGAVGGAAAGRP